MSEFKKGDIVVCNNKDEKSSARVAGWEDNLCFKIKKYAHDCYFGGKNGHGVFEYLLRQATDLEAAEYKRLGKPFDVTTLKPKIEVDLTGRYLKALIDGPQSTSLKEGDEIEIIKRLSDNKYRLADNWMYTTNNQSATDWEVLPEDKIKTELTINDLVEGEIYVHDNGNICEWSTGRVKCINNHCNGYQSDDNSWDGSGLRSANFSERQWLSACIEAGKFISKDEALNPKPEYVEYKDKIYKVKEWTCHTYCKLVNSTKLEPFKNLVEPSTKEAFEAQNSEFVLPKYWHVQVTKENRDILSKWRSERDDYKLNLNHIVGYCDMHSGKNHNPNDNKDGFGKKITFDQFKKYVLKNEEVKVSDKTRLVHCPNQAAWDFAAKKLGRNSNVAYKEAGDSIVLSRPGMSTFKHRVGSSVDYEVLTFQQWLDEFGHNEAWKKVIDADFGKIKPAFKVGDCVWLDKSDIKSLGVVTGFNAEKDCVLVDPIINNHYGNGKDGWNIRRCTLATGDEVHKANSDYQRKTVGPKTITQTSFNRDFYVKVNSQEEADAMFDYLRSQGEEECPVNKCRSFSNGCDTIYYNQGWLLSNSNMGGQNLRNISLERPLSDFITIPASTNDSDPLGIIGKKFTVDHNEIEYLFKSFDSGRYLITFINSNGEKSTTYLSTTKAENCIESRRWKIIEDDTIIAKGDNFEAYDWKRPDVIDAILFQNQLGMIRKNIVPEPKIQELVDAEKYFPKEEELSLDDLLREV